MSGGLVTIGISALWQFLQCLSHLTLTFGDSQRGVFLKHMHVLMWQDFRINATCMYDWSVNTHHIRSMTLCCIILQGLKLGVVRFRFDGNPINETDTPSGVSPCTSISHSFSWFISGVTLALSVWENSLASKIPMGDFKFQWDRYIGRSLKIHTVWKFKFLLKETTVLYKVC